MRIDTSKFNCAGCSACANICPVQAISMKENEDGFYIPFIDEAKCTNCGLCQKICPENNQIKKNTGTPECWAVMADDEIRKISSSGGAFTVIADSIFAKGGVVVGAAFDENWVVKHIIIENKQDMGKLRGSKYVQSFVSEDLYKKLKALLDSGRWVLFTGTPCQVQGFKAFLSKDYNNLILVDLICSKVPPMKAFDKYLNDLNIDLAGVKNINFREKENGWNCSTIYTTTTTTTRSRFWFRAFLNSLMMNESCVNCKYMSISRVGDMTIGDFWGIKDYRQDLDDNKGTSIVLVNTPKGKDFFEKLDWKVKAAMTNEQAIHGNRALLVPFIPHRNRNLFMKKLKDTNFEQLVSDCLTDKYNVGVLNWWWNSNRGAILTCYAIQELIKDLGFNPSVIKHIPFDYYNKSYKGSISEKFADKYLNLTHWCHSRVNMRDLNNLFSTFVVGSDQVWNHDLNWFLQDFYYLNFANINKRKIACAASFGSPKFTGNERMKTMVKYYLKRFDNISVREQDAVNLCSQTFDANATFILDPVFLIDRNKYDIVIKDSKVKCPEKYIAYYFINDDKQKRKILNDISKQLNLPLVDVKGDKYVEDWLYLISNAQLVVSDSFHASCFSIIYNKKFLTISKFANSRFETLGAISGLQDRFVKISDFNLNKLDIILKDENWVEVENKIKPLKIKSIQWLRDALEAPVKKYDENQVMLEAFYASLDDRLNLLEGRCLHFVNKHDLKLNISKSEIAFKYKLYCVLSSLTIGKYKKKNQQKKNYYKKMLKEMTQQI